ERRESERAVAIHFDKLSTRSEQEHGPELRVHAAAQDELVSFRPHHRLNRDSEKACRARLCRNGSLDGLKCLPDRIFVKKVQLYAADVGLVRDGFRMDLQHYRE